MARLAHAMRRSTALYVAAQVTSPEDSVDDMLVVADRLAEWIRSDIPIPAEAQTQTMPSFPTR